MTQLLKYLAKIKASPETAQQWAHFSIPLLSILIAHRFHADWWILILLAMFWWIFGLLVEVIFDPEYEHDPFWPKGFRDFCFYVLGPIVGLALTL